MRLIVIFGIFLLLGSPFQLFSQEKKGIKTAIIKTYIYCDHCKECESCGDKFLRELYNEKGIKNTEVDTKNHTIKVVYDTRKTSLEQIKQHISKLGYDADEVKADSTAASKLDECCRKR